MWLVVASKKFRVRKDLSKKSWSAILRFSVVLSFDLVRYWEKESTHVIVYELVCAILSLHSSYFFPILLLVNFGALLRDEFLVLVPTRVVVVLHVNRKPFAQASLSILCLLLFFLGAWASFWDEWLVLVPIRVVLEIKLNLHRLFHYHRLFATWLLGTGSCSWRGAVRRRRIHSGVFISTQPFIECRAAVSVVILVSRSRLNSIIAETEVATHIGLALFLIHKRGRGSCKRYVLLSRVTALSRGRQWQSLIIWGVVGQLRWSV